MSFLFELIQAKDAPIGTIVSVEFPYEEDSQSKRRPAVVVGYRRGGTVLAKVIGKEEFADDAIVSMVTSHLDKRNSYLLSNCCLVLAEPYLSHRWLKKLSVLKCNKVAYVDNVSKLAKIGSLTPEDRKIAKDLYDMALADGDIIDCGQV